MLQFWSPGAPFRHLESTLEDDGNSRMDTRGSGTGRRKALPFWHAFSAYARLELQGEPFQHHFYDLVLFLLLLLHIFKVTFAENTHNYWRSFGSFCASFFFSVRACRRSEAERSGAKRSEAVAWSRPRRRRGPKTTSEALSVSLLWRDTAWDLPVLCNIASTILLSVFWQLRFSSIRVWF